MLYWACLASVVWRSVSASRLFTMARKEGDKEKKASSRSKLGVAAGSGVQSSGTKGGTAKHGKLSKGERKKAAQERRKGAKPVKQTYWAVQVGRAPGVYTDLDEYEKQVKGFPGAKAKKFKTQRLADAFVANVDKAGAKKEKKRKKAAASNSAEAGATAKATKVEFWAVRVGRIPGVYTSLERVQEQVHGFSGADYKKFKLEHEAQAYAGVVSEPILLVRARRARHATALHVRDRCGYVPSPQPNENRIQLHSSARSTAPATPSAEQRRRRCRAMRTTWCLSRRPQCGSTARICLAASLSASHATPARQLSRRALNSGCRSRRPLTSRRRGPWRTRRQAPPPRRMLRSASRCRSPTSA